MELDPYVVETLLPDLVGHDRRPGAFIVYLVLWTRASRSRTRTTRLSLRVLSEATGLSRRGVQDAVRWLMRRRLVAVERTAATAVPSYVVLRPWVRARSS
jgi:hypothetical protein